MINDIMGSSHIPGICGFPGSGWESPAKLCSALPCYSTTPKLFGISTPCNVIFVKPTISGAPGWVPTLGEEGNCP